MSDSNCIVCFEALNSAPLGATSCGHCFHQECWEAWARTAAPGPPGRAVKCPMCNSFSTSFTKLFLNIESNDNDDDDDDDSLSLASSVEEEEDENAMETQPPVPLQKEEDDRPKVIEVDKENSSVVEILSDAPSPQRKRDRNNNDNDDVSRMKRKAKRLKKRNKFLEAQRKDFIERERKLLDDFSKTRTRLETIEEDMESMEDASKSAQRELEHSNLEVTRLRRERDSATVECKSATERLQFALKELDHIKQLHRTELSKASAKGLKEFKQLEEQFEHIVTKNQGLNEIVAEKTNRIDSLEREVERLKKLANRPADEELEKLSHKRLSSNKSAKTVAKIYTKALEVVEENKESARKQQEQRQSRKESSSEVISRLGGKNSAHAARMVTSSFRTMSNNKSTATDVLNLATRQSAKRNDTPPLQRREPKLKRHGSTGSESSSLGGTNLNVSAKRRRVQAAAPLPSKRPATQKQKSRGTNANIRDMFQRQSSARR